jgi:hypothetical protein
METDSNKLLKKIRNSTDIVNNIGRFHLEYKIRENVKTKEVTFFAFNSTLVILKGEKILKKVNLRKYKDTYFLCSIQYQI